MNLILVVFSFLFDGKRGIMELLWSDMKSSWWYDSDTSLYGEWRNSQHCNVTWCLWDLVIIVLLCLNKFTCDVIFQPAILPTHIGSFRTQQERSYLVNVVAGQIALQIMTSKPKTKNLQPSTPSNELWWSVQLLGFSIQIQLLTIETSNLQQKVGSRKTTDLAESPWCLHMNGLFLVRK